MRLLAFAFTIVFLWTGPMGLTDVLLANQRADISSCISLVLDVADI